MKRKHLLPLLLFVASLFTAGIASAYPFTSDDSAHWPSLWEAAQDSNTIPQFTGAYTGPTYYTLEGFHNKTKAPYYATLYIDPSRDLKYRTSPYGIQQSRNYYGEYVSGNILGDLTNLTARYGASDNFGLSLGGGMGVYDGQGLIWFESPTFHWGEDYIFSSLHVGDWIMADRDDNPDNWIFLGVTKVETAPAPVPEPATCMLVASGLAGLGLLRRRANQPSGGI